MDGAVAHVLQRRTGPPRPGGRCHGSGVVHRRVAPLPGDHVVRHGDDVVHGRKGFVSVLGAFLPFDGCNER
eukprot:5100700-Prymnesium_polylepis.1